MDPNTTLACLIAAICGGDMEGAREHFDALEDWIGAGGFRPTEERQRRQLERRQRSDDTSGLERREVGRFRRHKTDPRQNRRASG